MGLNNEKSITPIKQNEDDREGQELDVVGDEDEVEMHQHNLNEQSQDSNEKLPKFKIKASRAQSARTNLKIRKKNTMDVNQMQDETPSLATF